MLAYRVMDGVEDASRQGAAGPSAWHTLNFYSEMSLCVVQFVLRTLWINSMLPKSAER